MSTVLQTGVLQTGVLIVGGGPAGLAPLLAAAQRGQLSGLLSGGLVVAEAGGRIGAGRIGSYAITSDSSAETFLSCVRNNPEPRLAALAGSPVAAEIAAYGQGAVPLALVGRFMDAVGDTLQAVIEAAPEGHVLTRHEALRTTRLPRGGWSTRLRCGSTGCFIEVISQHVIVACGGFQPEARLERENVAGQTLLPLHRDKLVQSDIALTEGGVAAIARRLRGIERPRIVIVGGSTSALACARLLLSGLEQALQRPLQPGTITLMHRRPLTVFYPSAAAARAENYTSFDADDICPVSGFVFRFGGLRFDSRELVMRLLGIAGRPAEHRIVLHRLAESADGDTAESRALLEAADVIVSCLGYRPRALEVFDEHDRRIALSADRPDGALVGAQCGLLDTHGAEIPGLYGIGLAAGFVAHAAMGGEPSFHGQMNGLWLWQNDVGAILLRRIGEPASTRASSEALLVNA